MFSANIRELYHITMFCILMWTSGDFLLAIVSTSDRYNYITVAVTVAEKCFLERRGIDYWKIDYVFIQRDTTWFNVMQHQSIGHEAVVFVRVSRTDMTLYHIHQVAGGCSSICVCESTIVLVARIAECLKCCSQCCGIFIYAQSKNYKPPANNRNKILPTAIIENCTNTFF